MTGILRVDSYNQTIQAIRNATAQAGLGYILRIQDKKETMVKVNNKDVEGIATSFLKGMGIQVFTPDGYTGFASTDRIEPLIAGNLVELACKLAKKVQEKQGENNKAIYKLSPTRERSILKLKYPYGSLDLNEIEKRLKEVNSELTELDPRLSVRTVFRVVDEEWRIARQDGTDSSFMTPRSFIYNIFTAKERGKTITTDSNLPGSDLSILIQPDLVRKLKIKSIAAAKLALNLLTARPIKSGSYKMVVDYALAKGLAHEAFGHAAETDGMESSILGKNGKMRLGEKVAADIVSIVDGPLEGDYAYQPISANGIKRETVHIVKDGILRAGLADLFSAEAAGVPLTGAGRVETCHFLPLARMSNIRIEVKDPVLVEKEFEEITPEIIYKKLLHSGLIRENEEVLYLTGYQGGQVNPASGKFVFNCSGIYRLGETALLYQPAIFSGNVLSALNSIVAGIGPLKTDAMGTCGKMFQGVPSSGGSHYFLLIDKNPEITIGGEIDE
jgi:TldD protein